MSANQRNDNILDYYQVFETMANRYRSQQRSGATGNSSSNSPAQDEAHSAKPSADGSILANAELDTSMGFCNLASSPIFEQIHGPIAEEDEVDNYTLPPKKSEFYAFLDNPMLKTIEKISKLTDFGETDKRTNYRRLKEYTDLQMHYKPEETNPSTESEISRMIPPPAMPNIECSNKDRLRRLPILTPEQFELEYAHKSKEEILQRIFLSGLGGDELKRRLWPYILGLVDSTDESDSCWDSYEDIYKLYKTQWTSVTEDQENRFTAFRDRKNVLLRDVVRCDRNHPFYSGEDNIEKIRELLMNYIMHDFDTGYIQGMTDLAAPLLFVFKGNEVKTFWCFVQMLSFTKKNFSMSKETIFYQLKMLFKLIQLTDPCFAQYLAENDSANCYFAFRWLICLFKREFVKEKSSDYSNCLIAWESIWCIHALQKLRIQKQEKEKEMRQQSRAQSRQAQEAHEDISSALEDDIHLDRLSLDDKHPISHSPISVLNVDEHNHLDKNDQVDSEDPIIGSVPDGAESEERYDDYIPPTGQNPRLDDVELYCLCICLSLIRRERDIIMFKKFEGCDILEHFNRLQLDDGFEQILSHALTIWLYLKEDGEEEKLYAEKIDINGDDNANNSSEGFDLLANDLKPAELNAFHLF